MNFNLYLLIIFRGAHVYNNILIISKYILVELSAFGLSVFNNSSQSTEK